MRQTRIRVTNIIPTRVYYIIGIPQEKHLHGRIQWSIKYMYGLSFVYNTPIILYKSV